MASDSASANTPETAGSTADTLTPAELSFFRLVREDWEANFRDWTAPGFRALFVNRFTNRVRAKSQSRIFRAPWAVVYRFMHRYCRNIYGIELTHTGDIGRRLSIHHHMGVAVHNNVQIGDDCILRQGVTIGMLVKSDHRAAPIIGHRVDIGAGAKILGNVRIGNDVTIGANAVVVRDVPDGWAALGNPARIVRLR